MMEAVLTGAILAIMVSVVAGLGQVWRGPTREDRMLSALLFGTGGVAILLLIGAVVAQPAFVDTALVFAILALIVSVAFSRNDWASIEAGDEGDEVNDDRS